VVTYRAATLTFLLSLVLIPVNSTAQQAAPQDPAWVALREGDHQKAARLFRHAIAAHPSDPLPHLGAGIAAHRLGDEVQAEISLKRALTLEPRLTPASALLGQIVYAGGDLDGAIAIYERALKAAPTELGMKEQLERWRKESRLHAGFEQGGDGRFSLLFEGPEERRLAERVGRVLETAYWDIGRRLNAYPNRTIPVILYTQEQFSDITRSPDWAVGTYDGRIRLAVRDALKNPAALDRVVVHELAHAIVHYLAPRGIPTWLHEGLAVNFEPGEKRWIEETLGTSERLVPLASLEHGFTGLNDEAAGIAYAESAAATRVIMKRLGPNLSVFLQSLESVDSVDSALVSFGFTTADLERSIRTHTPGH
jgi:tetratricopeptide (TPR) repeat protein